MVFSFLFYIILFYFRIADAERDTQLQSHWRSAGFAYCRRLPVEDPDAHRCKSLIIIIGYLVTGNTEIKEETETKPKSKPKTKLEVVGDHLVNPRVSCERYHVSNNNTAIECEC